MIRPSTPFLMGKSTISMAIFNCYVRSPEGMPSYRGMMSPRGLSSATGRLWVAARSFQRAKLGEECPESPRGMGPSGTGWFTLWWTNIAMKTSHWSIYRKGMGLPRFFGYQGLKHINTLWWTNKKLWKMAIEIVDFPINSMVIFHSYVNVHQRVLHVKKHHMVFDASV